MEVLVTGNTRFTTSFVATLKSLNELNATPFFTVFVVTVMAPLAGALTVVSVVLPASVCTVTTEFAAVAIPLGSASPSTELIATASPAGRRRLSAASDDLRIGVDVDDASVRFMAGSRMRRCQAAALRWADARPLSRPSTDQ